MMKRFYRYILLAVWVLLLASCSSTKKLFHKEISIEGMSERDYMARVVETSTRPEVLTAKVGVNLRYNGSKKQKVNATLRIKKGEAIQLVVAPFLGIEVARAEITPNGILVLDRMNKRYVKVSFAELSQWVHADVNYYTLQALFLNELFLPGQERVEIADLSRFAIQKTEKGLLMEVKRGRPFAFQFYTQAPEGWLKESNISVLGTPYQLQWGYGDFHPLNQSYFPSRMNLSIKGLKKPVELNLAFSRVSTEGKWEVPTTIPSKYKQIRVEDLIKLLLSK